MDFSITSQEKDAAKELLAKLNELYTTKASQEVLKKEREEKVKTEICHILNIKNKKGEPTPNKVKIPLLLTVIEEKYEGVPNKEQQRYDTMCDYKNALNSLPKQSAIGLIDAKSEIKATELDIKSAYTEGDASILSGEVIEALALIAKDRYVDTKNMKMAEAGFKVSDKAKKVKPDLSKLKKALLEELKKDEQ